MARKNVRPPNLVYHATAQCNEESIKEKGLLPFFGDVYAASSPQDALTFMGMRLFHHLHVDGKEIDCPNGAAHDCTLCGGTGTVSLPHVVDHDYIVVFTIDTSHMPKKWYPGTDHNPEFFGNATSWVYTGGPIPPKALINVSHYTPAEEN